MYIRLKFFEYVSALKSSPLGYRFAQGFFWSISGAIIYQVLMVGSSVMVARALGKATFGQLGVVTSTVAMVSAFVSFGLGITANKFVAEFKNTEPKRAGKIIGLSGLLAFVVSGFLGTVLVLLSPWLAADILSSPELLNPIRLSAIIVLLTAAKGSQLGALSGLEAFKSTAIINIIVGFSSLLFVPIGAHTYGLIGAVYGLVVVISVNYVSCFLALRKQLSKAKIKIIYKGCFDELTIFYTYSAPAIFSSILQTPTIWMCNALLVNQIDGYAHMGVYNAAIKFQILISFCSTYLGSVLFSMLSSQGRGEVTIINKLNISLPFILSTMVALPLAFYPDIIAVIFGKDYSGLESNKVLVLVAIFSCLLVLRESLVRILSTSGRMWWVLTSNAVSSLVLVSVFYTLRDYGAVGLAFSFLVSHIASIIILHYLCGKLAEHHFVLSKNLGLGVVVFSAALFNVFYYHSYNFSFLGLLFGLMYIAFNFTKLYRSLAITSSNNSG